MFIIFRMILHVGYAFFRCIGIGNIMWSFQFCYFCLMDSYCFLDSDILILLFPFFPAICFFHLFSYFFLAFSLFSVEEVSQQN